MSLHLVLSREAASAAGSGHIMSGVKSSEPGEDSGVKSKAERLKDKEHVRLVGQTTSEWWIGQSAVGLVHLVSPDVFSLLAPRSPTCEGGSMQLVVQIKIAARAISGSQGFVAVVVVVVVVAVGQSCSRLYERR